MGVLGGGAFPYERGTLRLTGYGGEFERAYSGTSLMIHRTPLGPHRRPVPRFLGGSQGGGRFLMGGVPL